MQQETSAPPLLEEMLRSLPGESWLLVGAGSEVLYAVGSMARPVAGALTDLVHPDDAARVGAGVEHLLAHPDDVMTDRVQVRHGDGSWRLVDLTAVNRHDVDALGGVVIRAVEVDAAAALPDDLIGSLAEAVPTPILVADQSGYVVFSNSAARTLLGDDFGHVTEQLSGARSQGTTRLTFELGRRWIHARIADRADGWVAMLDDVTADSDNDLVRMATTDPLTGLTNRGAFDAKLAQVLAAAAADEIPVSIVFVDLDGFKRVNDQHGPAAGDQVLKVVAARLKRAVRPGDVVARVGGDDFGMICPGLSAEHAPVFGERLAETIRERMNIGAARVVIGAVVATATSPPSPADAAGLISVVEQAMYRDTTFETWTPQIEL